MLLNPCSIAANSSNTGSECSDALKATAMLFMVPKAAFWTESDMADFTAYIQTKIHAATGSRWYPIFGSSAPVRGIADSNEADVIETLDDGSKQFIRRGYYNREFSTTEGGMCLARHLFAFIGTNYAFVEVDIEGKVAMKKNANGTFSGFPVALAYAPSPELANLKTSYKNKFMLSFSPNDYIGKGEVFSSDDSEDLIDLKGLLDTAVLQAAAPATSGGTAPSSGTTTLTAVGADGNTIDLSVGGYNLTGGPVVKTSAESTVTLLAVKIVAAITAAASTNGGITATNSAGVITYVIPAAFGASINGASVLATIVGTITETHVAFSGGADGTVVLKVAVETVCGETDLIDLYPGTTDPGLIQTQNFIVKKDGVVKTATIALVSGHAELTVTGGAGSYNVALNTPAILKGNGVEGYEGTQSYTVQVP